MEIHQIRYFLALADTLNFTRAAEACNVTQPALTRAIQALEGELGGDLIRRERRTSHLTELGQRMLPLLRRCYDSAMSAKALARSVAACDVAPLTAAISHTVNVELLADPLAEMFRAFPGLRLRIVHGGAAELLAALREGRAEIALGGPMAEGWARLDSWPLFDEGFEIAAPAAHPLAAADPVGPGQLDGVALLTQAGCESRGEITAWLETAGVASSALHEVETQTDLTTLLEAGLGVAIVPESAPRSPRVRRARLTGLTVRRQVSAYTVAGRPRGPAVAAFLNLLRASSLGRAEVQRPAARIAARMAAMS